MTALMYAIMNDSKEVFELLKPFEQENVTDSTTSLIVAVELKKECYSELIKYAGKLNKEKETALYIAIKKEYKQVIQTLLPLEIDIVTHDTMTTLV